MKTILLIVLSVWSLSADGAPLTSYDQRQEGELNVKVDLDNFVIVVARPSSSFDLLGSMASLFSDAKRNSVPFSTDNDQKESDVKLDEHEDDKAKELDDVSLDKEPQKKPSDEAMIIMVQTSDTEDKTDTKNIVGELVRTMRNLKTKEASAGEKAKTLLGSKYKFVDSVDEPQSLKLIGDAIENCGPGRSRDRFGICHQDRGV